MKNGIEDLRNHLFATLEALQDKRSPMDIDRARAIAEVAHVLVNSARVEVDFLRVTLREKGTGFIVKEATPALPERTPMKPALASVY
jgi:hypothetical protein